MSTMAQAPPIPLDGPLPVAPAFNFFSVAHNLATEEGRRALGIEDPARPLRWQAGVSVVPRPSDTPFGWDPCSEGTMRVKETGGSEEDDETESFRDFFPFVAYIPDYCSALGIGTEWERFKELVESVQLATVAFAAERQFAQGQPMGDNPSLNDSNLTPLLGANVGPVEGLALLENAIGRTGRAGVLHATPAIATMWSASRLLLWTGDVIRTVATRTPVIVGHGYIDTDPDTAPGPSSDIEYAFATGPIFYGLGELMPLSDEIAESLDRGTNEVVYRAEQEVLVGWDGVLQAGVSIDRSATP